MLHHLDLHLQLPRLFAVTYLRFLSSASQEEPARMAVLVVIGMSPYGGRHGLVTRKTTRGQSLIPFSHAIPRRGTPLRARAQRKYSLPSPCTDAHMKWRWRICGGSNREPSTHFRHSGGDSVLRSGRAAGGRSCSRYVASVTVCEVNVLFSGPRFEQQGGTIASGLSGRG